MRRLKIIYNDILIWKGKNQILLKKKKGQKIPITKHAKQRDPLWESEEKIIPKDLREYMKSLVWALDLCKLNEKKNFIKIDAINAQDQNIK